MMRAAAQHDDASCIMHHHGSLVMVCGASRGWVVCHRCTSLLLLLTPSCPLVGFGS
jgi:hypothetical protein